MRTGLAEGLVWAILIHQDCMGVKKKRTGQAAAVAAPLQTSQRPEVTLPDVTVPDATGPDGTVPDVIVLDVT